MREKLEEYLSKFLRSRDRVLICSERGGSGRVLAECVRDHGGEPVFWGDDVRWNTLLKMAFTQRYRVMAGPPQLLLSLSKLSKQLGTPLYIRNVILTEDCPDWVRESIEKSLDCKTWSVSAGEIPMVSAPDLMDFKLDLLRWSSVIDCRIVKGTYGLEMQIISIPGKKLPKFPTCAKLDIQPFDPERHIPFYLVYDPKKPGMNLENH